VEKERDRMSGRNHPQNKFLEGKGMEGRGKKEGTE